MLDEMNRALGFELPAALQQAVSLPAEWTEYFVPRGPVSQVFDDRRRFPRYYYRGYAVLELKDHCFRIVTKDLARGGVGFYHHEQLFPLQEAGLWLPGEGRTHVRISRCLRIGPQCYECGATFLLEADREAAQRQITRSLAGH
jgi:hypothetical protein